MSMFASGKVAARVESSLFHAGAVTVNGQNLGTTNPAHYALRSLSQRTYYLPLAEKGAIDLGFTLHHNLTIGGAAVSLNVTICDGIDLVPALAPGAAGSVKNGQKLWTGTIPGDARVSFVSERSSGGDGAIPSRKVIEVAEFRQPLQKFILEITPSAIPDAGDMYFRCIWRY